MSQSLIIHAEYYAYSCLINSDCKHLKKLVTLFNIHSYITGLYCKRHGQNHNLLQYVNSSIFILNINILYISNLHTILLVVISA